MATTRPSSGKTARISMARLLLERLVAMPIETGKALKYSAISGRIATHGISSWRRALVERRSHHRPAAASANAGTMGKTYCGIFELASEKKTSGTKIHKLKNTQRGSRTSEGKYLLRHAAAAIATEHGSVPISNI